MNSGGHRGVTVVTVVTLIFAPVLKHHGWVWKLVGKTKETQRLVVTFLHSTSPLSVKAVILAGGFGSRLSEETAVRPKPMVEIGGRPMLWHIMKYYAHYGMSDFVIALGYRGDQIKRYMVEYASLQSLRLA